MKTKTKIKKNDLDTETPRPKFVSGIDTIYFQVKIDMLYYTEFYYKVILSDGLLHDKDLKLLSHNYEGQYINFSLLNNELTTYSFGLTVCRIRFKNLNSKDGLESIYVQMESPALQFFGYKESCKLVIDKIEEMGLKVLGTKISRADLNTFVLGHNFDYLDYELFSSKKTRSGNLSSFRNQGILETFYLGSRGSSSPLLRIYNKSVELGSKNATIKEFIILNQFRDKYNIEFPQGFFMECGLWNVEFELRREALKTYKIDTLNDLFDKVNDIHYDLMTNRIRLLSRVKNKSHNSRIPSSDIWISITDNYKVFTDRVYPITRTKNKSYTKNKLWLINRMREFIDEKKNTSDDIKEVISFMDNFYNKPTS